MSWVASAFVKGLARCPDGAPMSRGQKLLALILADYHNTHRNAAWPSVPTLAEEALTSHAQAKRDLGYLEEHGLIRKVRPEKMGRGWVCAYEFPVFDEKVAHGELLFSAAESGSKVAHLNRESRSEVAQKGLTTSSAIRKNKELELFELGTCEKCGGVKKLFNFQAKTPEDRIFVPCPCTQQQSA
jgi:hypothetical protein